MPEVTVPETNARRGVDQILDVRENSEVAEGMIQARVHIPMGELHARLNELDPAIPVIAVCRSGNRSATAADALNQAGFTAATMTGGMIAWQRAELPTT
ncbi:rhodanese-like domain-containing protein [Arthrobacter roseus]|uniref:rhodanese-like domain-containing protein n=1 Tax=Arthrobacter roseus TaxID=136274 RepID=UPI0019665117|nr:rhodanese-like domain-containing protein [Arthrobacter roseus]MBM7848699.1 rhodanese-related sulfurtransferase [Arthrobacter roseus]